MIRRALAAGLLLLVATVASAFAGDPSGVAEQLAEWKSARTRPFTEKIVAAQRLIATRDVAALKELLAECGREAKNQDKFRELLAPRLAAAFAGAEFVPVLREAFRERLNRPDDAWLVFQVARAWTMADRPDAAIGLFLAADRLPFHQAATLRALAAGPDAAALALAQEAIDTLPSAEPQRTLLLEASARVIEANAEVLGFAGLRSAVEPILCRLAEKACSSRSATVLCRSLARIFRSDTVYADSQSWRAFLDDRNAADKLAELGQIVGHSYFAGVMLSGRDIVYVIDSSGSMDQPFTWRPTTPGAGPVSGKGADEAERKRREEQAKRDQDLFRSLKSLPWDKIRTRLDAVREALKASLRGLREEQRFAVVVFSDEARFVGHARLMEATHSNVENTCANVDRLEARGDTNVHRALELAFGASKAKLEDPATGVGVEQLLSGADTIVLLTDGAPTIDDYDPRGQGGLYASIENILLACRRWNLLFDAEIDCVGLADAPERLIEALSRQGNGKSRYLGR